jgi:CRP-like cAMP-binding protein
MLANEKSCNHCQSFQSAGFSLLNSENQKKLDNFKQSKHFKKNEIIFSPGSMPTHVYCLRSGLVKLEMVGEEGHTVTLGFMKGGDILGLAGVLSKGPMNIYATAIEDTYACAFAAHFFHQILQDTPELAMHYLSNMFNELRQTQQRLLSGVDKDVYARVAEALVFLKANYPNHTFTRKEIAEWAGTTTESVIRTLSQFEDDGLIAQTGRQIQIRDLGRLNHSAGVMF